MECGRDFSVINKMKRAFGTGQRKLILPAKHVMHTELPKKMCIVGIVKQYNT